MSLPIETQRTIEAMQEDFIDFCDKGEWSDAEAAVDNMREFDESRAAEMKKHLTHVRWSDQ